MNEFEKIKKILALDDTIEQDNNNNNIPNKQTQKVNMAIRKGVNELLELRKILDENKKLFSQKQEQLLPLIKEPVVTLKGTVFPVSASVSKISDRKRMLNILINKLKLSPATAQLIIEQASVPKYIDAYLKVLPNKQNL